MLGRLLAAILIGGLVAGTIDIGAASLINHMGPARILRAIASGWMGKAALKGGGDVVMLGLGLQWAMSVLIAAIYVVASLMLPFLRKMWLLWGLLYGVGVYVVMTYVVVPLSNAPFGKKGGLQLDVKQAENLVAMLLFGLIIAFCASRYLPVRKPAAA
jgi:hypothetical protein